MSAEGPPKGANYPPYGGSAAAELVNEAASVGTVHDARTAPPRIWNKRVQRRARRLERAATRLGSRLTGKLVDADSIVALLEEAIEPADRVCIEGDNQKQADGRGRRRQD